MSALKIFVAEVPDVRLQHRMEAGLMAALYDAPEPYCGLPDRGMFLVPRREQELAIAITDTSNHRFINLPETIFI
jgi:hypothetical protein